MECGEGRGWGEEDCCFWWEFLCLEYGVWVIGFLGMGCGGGSFKEIVED